MNNYYNIHLLWETVSFQEVFEDTKGVIRIRKWKGHHNKGMNKYIPNSTIQTIKDRATRTKLTEINIRAHLKCKYRIAMRENALYGFLWFHIFTWMFIVIARRNNIPWVDISLHTETLSWLLVNQPLLFLTAYCCVFSGLCWCCNWWRNLNKCPIYS